MKNFQALVREIKVFDHAYFGPLFTWSNNQLDRPFAKKLHRVLVKPTVVGDPMLNLFTKLKRLKLVLKMLNTEAFDNIFARVKAKAKELESLKLALLQGNEKAPSSNSFAAFFFKSAWGIVGLDFLEVVQYSFASCTLLAAFNATSISFVPKCDNLSYSAFVRGRSITNNTMLAHKLMRGVQGFLEKFLKWIEVCLTTYWFFVSFNGSLMGFFQGRKCIRQGDPLSPYLFVLAMDVLSRLLDVAAINALFKYHSKCLRVQLTHIMFADDLIIFSNGIVNSVAGVYCVLQQFYLLFGLQLNASKSELFVVGVPQEELAFMITCTGFKIGRLPVRYLGVPLVS
ncbi:uncharacterized protein LOC128040516 [Gossypium raimondii]|uniref:uncharacterized protein LOC128040516 n=1 Tax=Gossypium raimondii TaxID=29730 RepID=UPI00227A0410|nr:uncharacterized protein LOC128040516 [Gossypium raimondii]